jgi:hypothetical protein
MALERIIPEFLFRAREGLRVKTEETALENKLRLAYKKALSREGSWKAVNEILENDQTGEARVIVEKLDREALARKHL